MEEENTQANTISNLTCCRTSFDPCVKYEKRNL